MDRKYAVIAGNFGDTSDRFCGSYKISIDTMQSLRRIADIPQVSGVELTASRDVCRENVGEVRKALSDLGLQPVCITPDLFGNKAYWKGSFTCADACVRTQAVDYIKDVCDMACRLGCATVNIWPGQDGYDYLLTTDYALQRESAAKAIGEIAAGFPELRISLEYKPKEPRTHSCIARMGDALLLALETGRPNVGVTLDTGHAIMAGEVVAESIVLAKRAGNKLFHMHFNDNYGYWDDDMIVGSVHTVAFMELLYWLDRCEYDGWLCMDQYPCREDAVGAIGESIEWLAKFDAAQREHRDEIDQLITLGDAVETSRFLRRLTL